MNGRACAFCEKAGARPLHLAIDAGQDSTGRVVRMTPAQSGYLRICLSDNAAKRVLRGIALGHRLWLLARSDRSGARSLRGRCCLVMIEVSVTPHSPSNSYCLFRQTARLTARLPELAASFSSLREDP